MTNVNSFYKAIIAEVIQKVSAEFINSGYEESTVRDLQALWEQKLNSSGSGSSASYEGSALQAELSRYPITQTNPINLPPMNIMTLVKPQPQFFTNSSINPLTMFQPQQTIFPPQMMIPRTAHMQPHMSVPIGQALPLPHLQYQNYPHGLLSKEQHNDQLHYGINMNAPLQQQPSQQAPLRPQSQSLNQVLNPGGPQQPYNVNHPPQQNYGMGMQGVNQQLLNQHQPAPNQPLSSQQVLNQTYPHQHYPNQQQNQQQQYPNAKNQPSIVPEEEEPNTPFQMFDSKSPQGNTPNLPSLSPFALPQTPTPNKLPISAITPIQSTTPTAPTTTTQTTTSTTSTAASAPTAQAPPSNSNTKKSSWMKLKSEMNQKTQETKKNQEASAPKVSTVAVSGGPVSPAPAKPKTPQAPTPKNHNPPQEDEEDELRSDDDDDSDEEPLTENLIVCTFDKVSRVKNKWKITLKCGVMNLNGRDYLFHRATGEGEW